MMPKAPGPEKVIWMEYGVEYPDTWVDFCPECGKTVRLVRVADPAGWGCDPFGHNNWQGPIDAPERSSRWTDANFHVGGVNYQQGDNIYQDEPNLRSFIDRQLREGLQRQMVDEMEAATKANPAPIFPKGAIEAALKNRESITVKGDNIHRDEVNLSPIVQMAGPNGKLLPYQEAVEALNQEGISIKGRSFISGPYSTGANTLLPKRDYVDARMRLPGVETKDGKEVELNFTVCTRCSAIIFGSGIPEHNAFHERQTAAVTNYGNAITQLQNKHDRLVLLVNSLKARIDELIID